MISNSLFIKTHKRCFCDAPELIENYEEAIRDTSQIWHCHHRLETHNSDGIERITFLTKKELQALDMYYHRPPKELIFLPEHEHKKLHKLGSHHHQHGVSMSLEAKAKASKKLKGGKNPRARQVICTETGKIFECAAYAAYSLGLSKSAVLAAIKRHQKCGSYHWEYYK